MFLEEGEVLEVVLPSGGGGWEMTYYGEENRG